MESQKEKSMRSGAKSPGSGAMPAFLLPILTLLVDYGIAGTLFLAPLAMAGRYPIGRFVLAVLVSLTTVSWVLMRAVTRKRFVWDGTGAEALCIAIALLVVVQLTPMSPNVLAVVSPHTSELLPLWNSTPADPASQALFPNWNRVTLAPHATQGGLVMLILYVFLFTVLVQRVRKVDDVQRLLKAMAVSGVGMAVLGLLQFYMGNGKFLWFYEHPSRDTLTAVKGTFANENHFAHFLALTIGPLLWWLIDSISKGTSKSNDRGPTDSTFSFRKQSRQQSRQQNLPIALMFGLGVMLLAGLLTYSRGGVTAILLAMFVAIGLFAYLGQIKKPMLLGIAAVGCVTLVAVWIHGFDVLAREVETLQTASLESLDEDRGRRKIWDTVMRAIPDFSVMGSGVGSHADVYPVYFTESADVRYSHAESGYLQVLLEAGVPGMALLLIGICWSGSWLIRTIAGKQDEYALLTVPLAAGWCVSVAHGVVDFNWYIPANMTLVVFVVAIALRLFLLSHNEATFRWTVPRFVWPASAVAVIALSTFCLGHYAGPARAEANWNEYLAWSLASNGHDQQRVGPGRQRQIGPVNGKSPDVVAWMMKHLDASLRHDPYDGRAHLRLAAMCLRQFDITQATSDNAMSLAEIRDAAIRGGFQTHEQSQSWVATATGERRALLDRALWHAKQGLNLNPLDGRGYVYLSELAFLDTTLQGGEYRLLNQAYLTRPNDPSVQFLFGRQLLLAGEQKQGTALWKEAFRNGDDVRNPIIAALAPIVVPEEIVGAFEPDINGLRDIFNHYRAQGQMAEALRVGAIYAAELESQADLVSSETASRLWYDAQHVYATLGMTDKAIEAAQRAIEESPSDYRNHFACALRLREAGRLEQALEELRWCHARRPEDTTLQTTMTNMEGELRSAGRPQRNSQR